MKVSLLCTPASISSRLEGEAVPAEVNRANALAIGKRIKSVGYMVGDDLEWPVPYVLLEDDTLITTSSDDEGNGPGVLTFEKKGATATLCETRVR